MIDLGKFFGWSNTMKRGTTVLVSMGRLLGISGLFRGDVDIIFDAYTSLRGAIDSGQIRPLASSVSSTMVTTLETGGEN